MPAIPESELILTASGAVYHLDLRPGEIADTVLTVGDPARVREVSKYFDKITHTAAHREFITHTGYIGNKPLTVVSSGIGTGNIDIVMNELDALANIDFSTRAVKKELTRLQIIRLGTCGGLQADIPTDGLVVSSYGIGTDNLLNFYQYDPGKEAENILHAFLRHTGLGTVAKPYIAPASLNLQDQFRKEGFYHGITVTCPGFYAPQGRMLRARPAFSGLMDRLPDFRYGEWRIANFEMETAAIYGMGRILGHECLSVCTVVANRVSKTFSRDSRGAIENMIKKSLGIITG